MNIKRYLKRSLLILIIVGINLPCIFRSAYSEEISKEYIRKGFEHSLSLIEDAQTSYVVQHLYGNEWKTTYEADWKYKPGKSFLRVKGYLPSGEIAEDGAWIYNGKNGYTINYQDNKIFSVQIEKREQINRLLGKTPPDSLFIRFWPGGNNFRGILSNPNLELFPTRESIDNVDCCVLYLQNADKRNGIDYKIWIDLQKGCLPHKIEIYCGGKLKTILGPIAYKNFGGDLWFPVEATFTWFSETYPNGQKGQVNYNNLKINQGIDDKIFNPTFDPGTEIYDATLGKSYKIPSGK